MGRGKLGIIEENEIQVHTVRIFQNNLANFVGLNSAFPKNTVIEDSNKKMTS
jgi:hypothetical protein